MVELEGLKHNAFALDMEARLDSAHSARLVLQFGNSIVPSSRDKAKSITMVNFNDYSADI